MRTEVKIIWLSNNRATSKDLQKLRRRLSEQFCFVSSCAGSATKAMLLLLPLSWIYLCLSCSTGSVAFALWRDVHSVTVVGGTHGNEFNGVWCVKRWRRGSEAATSCTTTALELEEAFPSLSVKTMIGNPKAYAMNRRFLDDDLNRMFRDKVLEAKITDSEDDVVAYEANRARAVSESLGPKTSDDPACDFVIDLHSTTSSMGITLIVDQWCKEGLEAAAYAVKRLNEMDEDETAGLNGGENFSSRRPSPADAERHVARLLVMAVEDRASSPFLSSVGRGGLEIEVGPTPQGVIRTDVIESMSLAVSLVLEYLHKRNTEPDMKMAEEVVEAYLYDHEGKVPWPIDEDGRPAAVTHWSLQGRDYELLQPGAPLFEHLNGTIIKYEPAPAVEKDDSVIEDILVDEEDPSARYPIFINEGAYYSPKSGLGIGMTRKLQIKIQQPL